MNFEQIEAFIYVSLTGSFSKAGDILFLSQPSVSARVKGLENEIGCTLFKRSGKNVALSSAGETFLPYAKKILQNVQEGKLSVQRENNKAEGELVISSVMIAANYILPSLIEQFHKDYPKIKLALHTGHSHHVLDMVLNHQVPLGISRAVNHPQIETTHLMDDEMVLAIYPEHPFSTQLTVSIEEVAKEPLILFNRGSLDWTLIHGTFNSLNVEPNVIMEVDSIEVAKQMVRKQLGISILPRFAIEEELKANSLQVVSILNIPQIHRNFEFMYLKGTTLDGISKLFIDFVMQKLSRDKSIS
jgi:DNA-binding transcriptional LysR family regulator